MAGEIFISYRRADEVWARLLYSQLKAEGVEAWYDAHVGAGQDWRAATAAALSKARIFVLLFSKSASESDDIAKELAVATFSKKLVVPVRLENIQPEGAFLYELASRNWVNAFENTEAKLAELTQSLATLVKAGIADESIIPFDRNAGAKARKHSWLVRKPLLIAAAAVMVMATVAALFWLYPRPAAMVASAPSLPRPAGVSVAVLPFLNLSPDKDQEFFSDGITEEITSALAKVPGLNVVARTSAFQFKGENRDIQKIGAQLHVTHLIEGSVRKDGNQVRITAQLIKAADGTHLWAESYNRELKGVFAIQEEVATAIAGALRAPLRLNGNVSLVSNRNIDPDSYEQYLRAKAAIRSRNFKDLQESAAILEQVVVRNPDFAPAWAQLSVTYGLITTYDPALRRSSPDTKSVIEAYRQKQESAARRAIQLDPGGAEGYFALGLAQFLRSHFVEADENLSKALAMDPGNADILRIYGNLHDNVGDVKGALKARQRAVALEPFVPAFNANLALDLWLTGRDEAAIALLKNFSTGYAGRALSLARVYASQGRFSEAADTLNTNPPGVHSPAVDAAIRLLRNAPAKAALQDVPPLGELNFVYFYVGAPERVVEELNAWFDAGNPIGTWSFWHPSNTAARNMASFKAYLRKNGTVDFWRARGWPDLCHPVRNDDFACD